MPALSFTPSPLTPATLLPHLTCSSRPPPPHISLLSSPFVVARRFHLFHSHSPGVPNSGSSEDTDAVFDDLLRKHGKVVFKRNDRKSLTDEADDDAESLSFAVSLAKVASEVKAADIRVLFVKPLVYWTRFFIIATAFSRPQIDAMGSKIKDMAEKKFKRFATGDTKPNSWTLLDFGDVVVHIFLPQQREYYNLEEFYGNATPIELPFDSQSSPFRK